jgi:copper chaperone CopZ
VRSLVKPDLAGKVGEGPYWFCPSAACEVVYFTGTEPEQRFLRSDLRVRVGQKETGPSVPLCYCFDWTTSDLEGELRLTGATTIPERVKEKVRQGFCRCETMNPLGTCCLGDVNRAAKEVRARLAPPTAGSGARQDQGEAAAKERTRGRAWLATLGAVSTAVAGSACCWLPLLLIAFGFSAAGIGNFLEEYRPHFLCATFALLAVGWFLTYRPALLRAWARWPGQPAQGRGVEHAGCCPTGPAAASEDYCAPHRDTVAGRAGSQRFNLRQVNQVMLWAATLVILLVALFPRWAGLFLGGDEPAADLADGGDAIVLDVQGMTCEGCAAPVRQALRQVPGVARVEMNYVRSKATVRTRPGTNVRLEALIQAVEGAGFGAR